MKTLNFTDRISYLAWRKEWREAYAQISLDIPKNKNLFKSAQRRIEMVEMKSGHYTWFTPKIDGKYPESDPVYYNSWSTLGKLRREAKEMLELRIQSKLKSAEQRAVMIAEKFPKKI